MCMSICGCYCKYRNELCYKSLVNSMFIMILQMVIVNTAMSCVIKFHGQYVLFLAVMLVIGVIEH